MAPSIETVVELVRACGFDLPRVGPPRPREWQAAAPKRAPIAGAAARPPTAGPQQDRKPLLSASQPPFDPYAILTALERHRVAYVLIGAFARVIAGTEELTHGVDLAPSKRAETSAD